MSFILDQQSLHQAYTMIGVDFWMCRNYSAMWWQCNQIHTSGTRFNGFPNIECGNGLTEIVQLQVVLSGTI